MRCTFTESATSKLHDIAGVYLDLVGYDKTPPALMANGVWR